MFNDEVLSILGVISKDIRDVKSRLTDIEFTVGVLKDDISTAKSDIKDLKFKDANLRDSIKSIEFSVTKTELNIENNLIPSLKLFKDSQYLGDLENYNSPTHVEVSEDDVESTIVVKVIQMKK